VNKTLQRFDAREKIEAIMFAYADAVDSGDLDKLEEIFKYGSIRTSEGKVIEGGRAVREQFFKLVVWYDDEENRVPWTPGRCTPRTRHVTTNVRFEFSDDIESAAVHSYLTVYQTCGGQLRLIVGATYEDRFEKKEDGAWYLIERCVHLNGLATEVPDFPIRYHLNIDVYEETCTKRHV